MKVIAISDTHNLHKEIHLPAGDLLLHAGDISDRGTEQEVRAFLEWFSQQPHPHKIFIAGNHDFFMERSTDIYIQSLIPKEVIYLNDSGITIEGINIWGSPIQPWFHDWAFQRQRGPSIDRHWQMIPKETDILITHGPAYGILDETHRGQLVGCEDLLKRIEVVQPRFFLSGHIHEAFGFAQHGQTTFINASMVNLKCQVVNDPVVFEVEKERTP